MMSSDAVIQSVRIAAAPSDVWNALVDARAGEKWRGADFKTDWSAGGAFEIEAKIGDGIYRDKGRVLEVRPTSLLKYAYWSCISGLPDVPENYSTIRMTLESGDGFTTLTVEQRVPPSAIRRGKDWEIGPESGRKHVEFYWRMVLPVLKSAVEKALRN